MEVARAAAQAGHRVTAFGSTILTERVELAKVLNDICVTSARKFGKATEHSIRGQLLLLWDYFLRTFRSLKFLNRIGTNDFAYAIADSWCDTIPLFLSRAKCKMLVLHMEAPRLKEILFRSRPDVDRFRVASLHYWASQKLSLALLRLTRSKHIFYVHPAMRELLLRRGFRPSEISPISFGLDVDVARSVADPPKKYDLAWIGRVHRQKGINDLLAVIQSLSTTLPSFRAVLIGGGAEELRADINRLGLSECVEFSGPVTEHEKVRFLKASRVFLMPSQYEGSPRTVGEALVCRVPVVAYAVPTYKAVFGSLVDYVQCFDVATLKHEASRRIQRARANDSGLAEAAVIAFEQANSWSSVQEAFQTVLFSKTSGAKEFSQAGSR